VKHDDEYLEELEKINLDTLANNSNKKWKKSFSSLVNRHLHTSETTLNVSDILWHDNLQRDNLPYGCSIST
jgi:hypothetical protein